MTDNSDNKISKIDAAIAAAKARKAARELSETGAEDGVNSHRITPEERAAKKEAIIAERAVRKAAKLAEREAKRSQKPARQKPAHMSKLERAAAKLPVLAPMAQQEYNDIITNFTQDQIAGLALWLQHYNRASATQKALSTKVEVGDTVTIVGGEPKWLGKTGRVTEVRRIRCFVELEGMAKPVYLFTSDVELSRNDVATGTEG